MEAVELMHAKLKLARRVLQDLVDHYSGMEDVVRLEKSNAAFDEIYSYLQILQNLVFPFIEKSGRHGDIIERSCTVQNQIDQLLERAIMMHVDEHGGEYYNDMVRLIGLVDEALRIDEQLILPWCRTHLSDADHYYIATHLKEQMTHESLSSSGLTIY